MKRAGTYLERAYTDGHAAQARENMSLASLLGGLALANAGLGVVHGFAAPIGGMFDAPHGAVCAALLPHCMGANIKALRARAPEHPALDRYREVAQLLTSHPEAMPEDGAAWVAGLCRRLGVQPLRAYGIAGQHIPDLVEKASRASSMKANPIVLSSGELTKILDQAL
jgi:alcohol dehydrogenase class IV